MRRYALARALKLRTRDWSPLPLTSSTNAGLMRNYLDGDAERGRTESMAPKEGPVLRWRMRQTEVRERLVGTLSLHDACFQVQSFEADPKFRAPARRARTGSRTAP